MPHKSYKPYSPLLLFFFAALLFSGCKKAEPLYSNHAVRFVFQNTQLVPQLNSALNNPGEFCTITSNNNQYVFHSPSINEDYVHNRTEIERQSKYILGLNGLIVGTPIIAEQLSNRQVPVCYDLACPSCYENLSITRALTLQENQKASCGRCGHTYYLNNQGVTDDGSTSLYRYRLSYGNNTLVASNE